MAKKLNLAALTYLVVDDSRYARSFMRDALGTFRIRKVVEAPSAMAAIDALKSEAIHFLVVDHEMPVITGTDLTVLIRHGRHGIPNPTLPILMVSGHTDETTVREALAAGVDGFLGKPFSAQALQKAIVATLGNRRRRIDSDSYHGPDRRGALDGMPDSGVRRRTGEAAREFGGQERLDGTAV